MRYIFRLVLMLVVLAAIAVVLYAYFGDMAADQRPFETPVTLEMN